MRTCKSIFASLALAMCGALMASAASAAQHDTTTMERIQSPRTDDGAIESDIQKKGLTAPRVTPADIEANVKQVEYVQHVSAGGQVLRWAVITTASGFAVTGRPSVAVSPQNDNAEIGEKVALANATNEMWPLMGYALHNKLAGVT